MGFQDYITIFALLASFFALILSFLNYRRGRKFENENHLFKTKLEVYSKILGEADRLIWHLNDFMTDIFHNTLTEDEIEGFSDLAFEKINEFNYLSTEVSLYQSNTVFVLLDKLINRLLDFDEDMSESDFNIYRKELFSISNEMNDVMRHELQLDELTASLFKRIKE